jgi:ribosomal protein S18 acetylase RimI-like enzyme
MDIRIRPAGAADAPLLSRVILMASRSHVPRGAFDLIVDGTDAQCLAFLDRLVLAEKPSFAHHAGYLVAEVDGRGVAALTGYDGHDPGLVSPDDAILEGLRALGWSDAACGAGMARVAPFVTCLPEDREGVWIVEFVATLPEYRRRGLVNDLLLAMLDRGRERGYRGAQISVLIGNTSAELAYEKAGFRTTREKRDPAFAEAMGCPGIATMIQDL